MPFAFFSSCRWKNWWGIWYVVYSSWLPPVASHVMTWGGLWSEEVRLNAPCNISCDCTLHTIDGSHWHCALYLHCIQYWLHPAEQAIPEKISLGTLTLYQHATPLFSPAATKVPADVRADHRQTRWHGEKSRRSGEEHWWPHATGGNKRWSTKPQKVTIYMQYPQSARVACLAIWIYTLALHKQTFLFIDREFYTLSEHHGVNEIYLSS